MKHIVRCYYDYENQIVRTIFDHEENTPMLDSYTLAIFTHYVTMKRSHPDLGEDRCKKALNILIEVEELFVVGEPKNGFQHGLELSDRGKKYLSMLVNTPFPISRTIYSWADPREIKVAE